MDATPWLSWLKEHQGQPEYTGSKPTAFVEECFAHTGYGPLHGSTPPSCAATLCAALEESGLKSPHNAAAISFAKFGQPCELKTGAIVVFRWNTGDHHVSVIETVHSDGTVTCLGGNQGHVLQPSTFNQKWIIATRWPQ